MFSTELSSLVSLETHLYLENTQPVYFDCLNISQISGVFVRSGLMFPELFGLSYKSHSQPQFSGGAHEVGVGLVSGVHVHRVFP